MNILAISGSLRRASFNSALLRAVQARAGADVSVTLEDISPVPLYNQDLEEQYPAEVRAIRERIRSADGVIIATPEYNRSVPGVLKNLIDWTSRPYGDGAWNGKPVYVMGASGGAIGTALAQYALKQSLLYLNARVMGQPEFYLGGVHEKIDAHGVLTDEQTAEHIDALLTAFVAFIRNTQ